MDRTKLVSVLTGLVAAALTASPAQAAILTANNNAQQLAGAMSSQDALVTGASFVTGPSASDATGTGGVFGDFPTDGTTFAALTTGKVSNAEPPNDTGSKGTNNSTTARGVKDVTILKVDINVPTNHNCVAFDFTFYSEEFPEFVGTQFNDGFIAELDTNNWSVSGSNNNAVSAPNNFAADTNGQPITVNTALGTVTPAGTQYDGATTLLSARKVVTAGAHSLYFSIYDAGDGIYDSAAFMDFIRTLNVPASKCTSGAKAADADGDSLPDEWEASDGGLDTNNDGTPELKLSDFGATTDHKDLYAEIDFMPNPDASGTYQMTPQAATVVQNMFNNAPVTNPDGRTGIRIHIDCGSTCPMNTATAGATWGTNSKANQVTRDAVLGSFSGGSYNWNEFDGVMNAGTNFAAARRPVFRYALSIARYGSATTRSSGIARVNAGSTDFEGSNFIVSGGRNRGGVDGTYGTNAFAGTFAHELGHTIGLHHGGGDDINYKPNYLSIMNYFFQFGGLAQTGGGNLFDYSRFDADNTNGTLAALNEGTLNETTGVVATGGATGFQTTRGCGNDAQGRIIQQALFNMNAAVDWNCSGAPPAGTVAFDLNADGTPGQALNSFDDWANIKFKGGEVGGFGRQDLVPGETKIIDDIADTQLQKYAQVVAGDGKKPKIKVKAIKRSSKRVTLQIIATDNKRIDQLIVKVDKKKQKLKAAGSKAKKKLTTKIKLKPGRHKIKVVAVDRINNQSKVSLNKRFKARLVGNIKVRNK